MPWTVDDVDRHNKNLTPEQKKTWVSVANAALERCKKLGGSNAECDASAIRQANSVVAKESVSIRFVKSVDEKQLVYGIVFEPDFVDAHDEFVSKDDVEAAAHEYLADLRKGGCRIKLSHQMEIDEAADVVESYIAPVDFNIGDVAVKEGSWVIAMKVHDPDLWTATKDQIQGFSPGGYKTFVGGSDA